MHVLSALALLPAALPHAQRHAVTTSAMTAVAGAASAFRRAQPPVAAAEVTAANGALLSGTLQRAVKAVFAQYISQLARALQLRQGVVATAVVRPTVR